MKITIELPDDTITGFVNFVYGNIYSLTIGTIALDGERIKNRTATYKEYLKNQDPPEGAEICD